MGRGQGLSGRGWADATAGTKMGFCLTSAIGRKGFRENVTLPIEASLIDPTPVWAVQHAVS